MKKILSIILIGVVIMGLSSCGGEKKNDDVASAQTVVFYKDGMKTEIKDNELYFQIVNVIESWYQDEEGHVIVDLLATTDLINEIKKQDMAIELPCVDKVNLFGFVVSEVAIFIPLNGEYKNYVFNNSVQYPDDWSGPTLGGKGLEVFFEGIEFEPIPNDR